MIRSTIELIKLTAAEGMTLTNGKAFGKEIYLGKNDSADSWYELPDSEAAVVMESMEGSADGTVG